MKLGIVAAGFHPEIMEEMLKAAEEKAKELGVEIARVYRVPGSYDTPLFAKKLLEMKGVEGVAVFGALVKGETDHDQIIAYAASDKLADLSLQYGKPVALGITGPGQTYEQAVARIGRAGDIIEACVSMVKELKK